jgi:hypothetical protein
MQKFARVCCDCGILVGCLQGKKQSTCDFCEKWDDCWMDLVEYKTIKESHGFCGKCLMKQLALIKDRRVKKLQVEIERRK